VLALKFRSWSLCASLHVRPVGMTVRLKSWAGLHVGNFKLRRLCSKQASPTYFWVNLSKSRSFKTCTSTLIKPSDNNWLTPPLKGFSDCAPFSSSRWLGRMLWTVRCWRCWTRTRPALGRQARYEATLRVPFTRVRSCTLECPLNILACQ
jgi:hypothetical protein